MLTTRTKRVAATGILTSRIGRRFVALFLSCAMLPLLVFAWVTLSRVTQQMNADLRQTLHYGAKTAGMGLAARLNQVAADLSVVSELELQHRGEPLKLHDQAAERCSVIWVFDGSQTRMLRGSGPVALPKWQADELTHLSAGKPLVRPLGPQRELVMVRALDPSSGRPDVIATLLGTDRFWAPQELRSPGAEFAVLDAKGPLLFHSFAKPPEFVPLLTATANDPASGTIEWIVDGEDHVARYWRAFLKPQYDIDLLIVQSARTTDALTVVDSFVRWFLMTAVATLLSVLFVSLVQMRRTLGPIVSLSEAHGRVAGGDLNVQVSIESRDEFGDLGRGFNTMTAQLRENVRQREQTERELVASRDAALAAARAKAEFVTNVSHEFRTPMTEVLGAAEILSKLDDGDPEARREFTGIVLKGAARLARLFDDVLELGSTVVWKTEPTDIGASIEDAVAMMEPSARARVMVEVAADLPPVMGVRSRLCDAWSRLLDNAAKFSRQDSPVMVMAWQHGGDVVIEFVDRGVGIAPKDQRTIFEPFMQVCTDQMTQKAAGAGLGLTLAKNTIERHTGRIEVESEPGKGATFRVFLPAMAAMPAAVS